MKILIPLLALAGYLWLASYSQDHGYTAKQVSALNELTARVTEQMFMPKNEQERADAIADVWQIDRSKPVDLILASGERQ